MLKRIKRNPIGAVLSAACAVIIIALIFSTVWFLRGEKSSVSSAVDELSEFYMEELVGKRVTVLNDALERNFEDLYRAVDLLRDAKIESPADLRDFLYVVRTLLGANRIAVADDNGFIYTARSTFTDASRYTYLQDNFTYPRIVTTNLYGANKQVVAAVPVENLTVLGKNIVACFIQLDIDDVAGSLTYEDADEETNIFIGLYHRNGGNLTSAGLDDVLPGENLLSHIRENYSGSAEELSEIERGFGNGEKGFAAVYTGESVRYIYYMPVKGTDWMLTVLVRDNTIEDRLEQTGSDMIYRNVIQVISAAVLIIAVSLIILILGRRSAEMRRKQSELEIRTRDEEELRAANAALDNSRRELEEQLSIIGGMSNAFFVVYAVDLKTRSFRKVKEIPVFAELTRDFVSLEDAVEALLTAAVSPDDREAMRAFASPDTLALRLGETDREVMEYHSFMQPVQWSRASWTVASRDENGLPRWVIYAAEDISAAVRERKSYEAQLRTARDEAQRASNAKTAFLFNMSHDIRTPMNAIMGFTDIGLAHSKDTALAADCFGKIKTAGSHLLSLINDILEMSRIEAGRLELTERGVDVLKAIDTITAMGTALALPRNIDYRTEIGTLTDRYVYADELHINEVIINLISNAVKYTPEGGRVRFKVSQTDPVRDGRAYFRFEVSDNGIGMSEEFRTHLFEAFSRENSSEVAKTEGAGLGLSIVKKIVEIAGGSISVKSARGEGSAFTVDIPFKVMSPEEIDLFTGARENPEPVSAVSLEGKRVLLVEDNEINREIASMMLTDAGLIVEEAENGLAAVNAVSEKGASCYDYVLMDIQMPVMDGYAATRAIRALPGTEKLPIIALSANAFEEDKKKSLAAGMNAHVAKPINLNELLRVMAGQG